MGKEGVKIEIMDTTLRDGEQTSGVSFVPHEKLMIARLLLEDLKVDRVEVASARVSDGEFEAVKMICDWAARRSLLHKVEVLGFVDGHTSVDWIQRTGCRVINLLCKGSLKHCTQQLKKTPEEHLADIISGALCRRTGYNRQCLSGRLEQRYQRFSRICISVDGWIERDECQAFYVA
jgi:D-citramalate synthase